MGNVEIFKLWMLLSVDELSEIYGGFSIVVFFWVRLIIYV